MTDARKAEKMIRNLARRLERDAPCVSISILEGRTYSTTWWGTIFF